MKRIAEPSELMNDVAQARAYAAADFSDANSRFIQLLDQLLPHGLEGHALDLGCGPGDIPLALLKAHPDLTIDALDGAPEMLKIAQQYIIENPHLRERLCLLNETLPSKKLNAAGYDIILSNSLVHHLADPQDLWLSLKHCARNHATVLIMDLARPSSPLAVDSLVETYASNEPGILREDFRNSLFAAYTVEEIRQQLQESGLQQIAVQMVSDRHWAASGSLAALD